LLIPFYVAILLLSSCPTRRSSELVSMIIMIVGYGIIVVPTGLVTAEFMARDKTPDSNTQSCPNCTAEHHKDFARYCYNCGHILKDRKSTRLNSSHVKISYAVSCSK